MNIHQLQKEVLQALRGDLSQSELSLALGYHYNQLYRWESGTVALRWGDFIKIINYFAIDLDKVFMPFFNGKINAVNPGAILKHLLGITPINQFAKQVNRSPRVLSRWINGRSEPEFIDILFAIYKSTNYLLEFAETLCQGKQLPSFDKEIKLRAAERQFHFKHPEFAAIVRALELLEYENLKRHSDRLVANKTGLPVASVKQLVQKAIKIGILIKRSEKLVVVNKSLFIAQNDPGRQEIVRYWLGRLFDGCNKIGLDKNELRMLNIVLTTNEKTYTKILELQSEFRNSLFKLLFNDDNRTGASALDRVVLLQNNIYKLGS